MPRLKANKKVLEKASVAAKNIPYGRRISTRVGQKKETAKQPSNNAPESEKNEVKKQITGGHCFKLFSNLKNEMEALADPVKAVAMKSYMRGKFEFLGIQAPARRSAAKQFVADCKKLNNQQIKELVDILWKQPEREYQFVALDVCEKCLPVLCNKTEEDNLKTLLWVKSMILTKSWWDTVDCLAVVGGLISHNPTILSPVMDDWIKNENMWLRRTAILHQLKYKNKTDQDRLFRYCLMCAHEEEFFIRKAIGWALRSHYYVNKNAVRNFVAKNKSKLSDLSIKEALKHD